MSGRSAAGQTRSLGAPDCAGANAARSAAPSRRPAGTKLDVTVCVPDHAQALDTLAAQHAVLRELIERCDAMADEVDIGMTEPGQLVTEVAQLRSAFDEHNRVEEHLLRPLLLDVDGLGAVRVSRLVDDHIEEHRAMRLGLGATPTAALRSVLAKLRDHLRSEEHWLLTPKPAPP